MIWGYFRVLDSIRQNNLLNSSDVNWGPLCLKYSALVIPSHANIEHNPSIVLVAFVTFIVITSDYFEYASTAISHMSPPLTNVRIWNRKPHH